MQLTQKQLLQMYTAPTFGEFLDMHRAFSMAPPNSVEVRIAVAMDGEVTSTMACDNCCSNAEAMSLARDPLLYDIQHEAFITAHIPRTQTPKVHGEVETSK